MLTACASVYLALISRWYEQPLGCIEWTWHAGGPEIKVVCIAPRTRLSRRPHSCANADSCTPVAAGWF